MLPITCSTVRRVAVDLRALDHFFRPASSSKLLSTFALGVFILAALVASSPSRASFHTYQINEIYTNSDGTLQFIELKEVFGAGGQNFLRGLTLTSGSGANTKSFTFPSNLPSSSTGGTSVLIATQGFAQLGLVTPDYIVPNNFIAAPAGRINYANVDMVNYFSLPTDGSTSINREAVPQQNSPTNFAGKTGSIPGATPVTGVTEFYNTTLNHYFVTADPIEAASVDRGASGPGWVRTGTQFRSGGSNAVCRFYGNVANGGPNSHFYTADAAECAQVKRDPGWSFESNDFAITPAAGGQCPAGLVNVYRAYNGRFAEHDSNHRLTTVFADYQKQLALGWSAEGVVMCAQP